MTGRDGTGRDGGNGRDCDTRMKSQSPGVSANVVTSRRSVEREGCGRDSVTRMQ